jgi:CBS domain containing-hemolysin-like protein
MTILVLVVFITILVSAQCSLYEATLYSTRMGTLEAIKKGDKRKEIARKMIQMKRKISEPIAAILILNTIANTAGATVAGMYAHQVLGATLVPVFSILFTLAILFFAEIIPKTMGVVHSRTLWPFIVWPLTVMKSGLYPVIKVTEKLTNMLTGGRQVKPITEEEILGAVRLGAKEGEISKWESLMVQNIISLEDMPVAEVMTPRTVVFSLDADIPVGKALEIAGERGFTRIPVYRDDKENILGYVMINDLASAKNQVQPENPLSSLVRSIEAVAENTSCLVLLNSFLKKRRHIAVVKDPYGGVAGLVTLEDLLEMVLGAEIVDERDEVADMQKLARRKTKKPKA